MNPDDLFLRRAIELARQGSERGAQEQGTGKHRDKGNEDIRHNKKDRRLGKAPEEGQENSSRQKSRLQSHGLKCPSSASARNDAASVSMNSSLPVL